MKLHIGCGGNYIQGWVNVDLDSPTSDTSADLRDPLPYPDNSVECIFNEHFLEHITRDEGASFLKECQRVLVDDGILRISTPDLGWLLTQYAEGRLDEWRDMGWLPISSCRMVNEGMRSWGHQFLYDLPELQKALLDADFIKAVPVEYRESRNAELVGLEFRPYHNELIIEARK